MDEGALHLAPDAAHRRQERRGLLASVEVEVDYDDVWIVDGPQPSTPGSGGRRPSRDRPAWGSVLDWHDAALRSLFKKHKGQEIKHAGDGFFVAFEDAKGALDCAVAIQCALEDHRRTQGFAPQVRIGVHTAEATDVGGDFRGMGVHEAARVAGAAEGNEILASAAALEAAGEHFKVTKQRTAMLKGLPEPVTLATIDWR